MHHCSGTTFNKGVSVAKERHPFKNQPLYAKLRRDISEKVTRLSGENELRFALWKEYLIQYRFQIASALRQRLVALAGETNRISAFSNLHNDKSVSPDTSDFFPHSLT